MEELSHRCDTCRLRAACEHTFGAYWGGKSGGGIGCNHPIAGFDVDALKDKLTKTELSRIARPCEIGQFHKYIVSYCDGREFTVSARSEKEAVNIVRYKHFQNTPFSSLGDFSALMIQSDGKLEKPKPSKIDILKRIRRMKG